MSRTDRTTNRARKAFALSVSEYAAAKLERHARREAQAERRERAARRAYLEALRSRDDSEAWA